MKLLSISLALGFCFNPKGLLVLFKQALEQFRQSPCYVDGGPTFIDINLMENLPSQFVIHAVGPRWLDGQRGEPDLLRRCYESIFSLALEHQISSLAIPSISTGIYHYPLDAAVEVAVEIVRQFDSENLTIIFACFDERTLKTYERHLED